MKQQAVRHTYGGDSEDSGDDDNNNNNNIFIYTERPISKNRRILLV